MFDNFNRVVIPLISLIRKVFVYEFFNLSLMRFFVENKTLSFFLIVTFVFFYLIFS